jgi:hypothetical protein
MAIGLRVRSNVWVTGSQEFVHAFFSTIARRLESGRWGSRFPLLQDSLYQGELDPEEVAAARAELAAVRHDLKEFAPSEIVWDIEDSEARPPWGDDISPDITDLSNYFVTEDGKDLFEVLDEALGYADRASVGVSIETGI